MKQTPEKKKGQALKTVLTAIVTIGASCIVGVLIGMTAISILPDGLPLWQELLFFGGIVLFIYAAIFLHIIAHEAGHLIFGLLSGYRFSSFRIGNVMWLKNNVLIVLRLLSIVGTGVQCLMVPSEPVDGKIPVVLYNLGGCLMNLLLSALCVGIWFLIPQDSIAGILLLIAALAGLILALMNGIPMRSGPVDNDGKNALSLGKNPKAMRAFYLQLFINAQVASGIRLKDMPEEWFAVPEDGDMTDAMVASQGVFATNYLMDAHRFQEAGELMAHLMSIDTAMMGLHKGLMICDQIYLELMGQNRAEVLEGFLTKEQLALMKSMKNYPAVIRTEYAYALLREKDEEKARKALELFEKVAKTYPYPSDVQSERELIELAQAL